MTIHTTRNDIVFIIDMTFVTVNLDMIIIELNTSDLVIKFTDLEVGVTVDTRWV